MTTKVSACPVERAIRVIGGKWKLLILRSLLLNGDQRYNDLLASVTAISSKELTRNLAEMGASGLVTGGRNTQYVLTDLGRGLMPMFQALLTWGQPLVATDISVR